MPIQEVKMFKTSDGETFEKESDAVIHENELIIKNKLQDFVDRNTWYNMSKTDIRNILFEGKDELMNIFWNIGEK